MDVQGDVQCGEEEERGERHHYLRSGVDDGRRRGGCGCGVEEGWRRSRWMWVWCRCGAAAEEVRGNAAAPVKGAAEEGRAMAACKGEDARSGGG